MDLTRSAAAVVALLLLAGCSRATGDVERVPDGDSTVSVRFDGADRSYRVHRPEGLTGPAALVVVLHGGFGSAEQAQNSYGWDDLADRHGFLVVYPDGIDRSWNVGRSGTGACCGAAGREAVDDVGFVEAVVADVSSGVDVAPGRLFATGMSNGAMLTYRLACESDLFAAVAPVAGTQLVDCAAPHPVSVLHVHGTADATVRLDGDPGDGRVEIDGPPVADVVAGWRAVDDCGAVFVSTVGTVTTGTADCADGRAVSLVTVSGAGHQWPGAPERPGRQRLLGTDPPSDAYDATREAWAFFDAHPAL